MALFSTTLSRKDAAPYRQWKVLKSRVAASVSQARQEINTLRDQLADWYLTQTSRFQNCKTSPRRTAVEARIMLARAVEVAREGAGVRSTATRLAMTIGRETILPVAMTTDPMYVNAIAIGGTMMVVGTETDRVRRVSDATAGTTDEGAPVRMGGVVKTARLTSPDATGRMFPMSRLSCSLTFTATSQPGSRALSSLKG